MNQTEALEWIARVRGSVNFAAAKQTEVDVPDGVRETSSPVLDENGKQVVGEDGEPLVVVLSTPVTKKEHQVTPAISVEVRRLDRIYSAVELTIEDAAVAVRKQILAAIEEDQKLL